MAFQKYIFFFILSISFGLNAADPSASDLVSRSEKHMEGESFQAKVTMTVDHDGKPRVLKMRTWQKGRDKSLVKILSPAKEKGTGNLRLKLDLKQFLPNINRIVSIPSSMMLQSWMGSDFTNDDVVRATSFSTDYQHRILAKVTLDGSKAYKIELIPKPTAPVVWGKVLMWLRDPDAVPMKREYYNEKDELIKTLDGSRFKSFGSHTIPTLLKMTNLKKNNYFTVLDYDEKTVKFDESLDDSLFSELNLKKPVSD